MWHHRQRRSLVLRRRLEPRPQTFEDHGRVRDQPGPEHRVDRLAHRERIPARVLRLPTVWRNTLTWQKGTHSVTIGGAFLHSASGERAADGSGHQSRIGRRPTIPPKSDVHWGQHLERFPGADAQLDDARNLYALLTGRVIAVTGEAALDADTNQYVAVRAAQRAGQDRHVLRLHPGLVALDADLTVTGGVRWDVQMPFTCPTASCRR